MSSHGADINQIIRNLERDLEKGKEWLYHNRLLISLKKTLHYFSTFKDEVIALNNNPNIELSQQKYTYFKDKNITFVTISNYKLSSLKIN